MSTENTPTSGSRAAVRTGVAAADRDRIAARVEQIWKQAYEAKSKDDLRKLYADWAETYDEDHEFVGFFGHRTAAELLAKYVPYAEVAPVLDAGAGTGAAGVELARLGFGNLTAIDLSEEMLEQAEAKGAYTQVFRLDLGLPLDTFPMDHFDAAILVGVFSYGQAPAHALDEIVRVVKPGGVVVFTMRTDFHDENAMGVRAKIERLEADGIWTRVEVTDPAAYLPKKDRDARFRVWAYRVLDAKEKEAPSDLAEAVRTAFAASGRVKRIDHCHIWNSMASRLYDRYIEQDAYYLVDCEEQILNDHATEIVGGSSCVVEFGCGSARKVKPLLQAAIDREDGRPVRYDPIDLSVGALEATEAEIVELFGDRVEVETRQGHFRDTLATIPDAEGKLILFFGGSIGNIESLPETVEFLASVRDVMTPRDRFVVGMDLHKDAAVLVDAYTAGPPNRSFFLNMVRRINYELGANFDLQAFVQESTYDHAGTWEGIDDRAVNLKLRTTEPQSVWIARLDLQVEMEPGDAIQVGTSRKFRRDQIATLAELAGMRLRRQWICKRGWFSSNELVRDDHEE